ncbi:MAG: hypothetical protein E7606_04575 [Ruminococcaceae bacterium]|nr:hypothetical protein [Oscillospiraceae bacterium]
MKFAKILSLFLALLMLLSMFAACGNTPDETTEQPKESKPVDDENDRLEEQDTVPTDLKYNGETINFLVRDASNIYKYELSCEEFLNDPVYDEIHYRNIDVETRLGVKIKSIAQKGDYPFTEWNNALSVSVLTNTGDYDGAAFYLSSGTSLAKEGIYYNLLSLSQDEGGYINFQKPWWNKSLVDELSVYGALYFAGGSLTLSQVAGGVCVFFNRDLFNQKYPDDRDATLYQLVRDGEWTADQMTYYVSNCWDDVNSNGVVDGGDVVGIKSLGSGAGQMDAWALAMGLDFTRPDAYGEPEIVLVNSHTVPAYEKVRGVFNNEGGYMPSSGDPNSAETTLENGNVLFYTQCLDYGAEMKASTVNYGVLPIPKYDVEQEDYRTCFVNAVSALAVCSNLSDERAAMVSAALELLSAESYKKVLPVYYETVIKGHYSREAADAEMYDRILDSFVFSFGFAWSTGSLGSISAIFRRLDNEYDIQQYIDSNKDYWDGLLVDLLTALDSIG